MHVFGCMQNNIARIFVLLNLGIGQSNLRGLQLDQKLTDYATVSKSSRFRCNYCYFITHTIHFHSKMCHYRTGPVRRTSSANHFVSLRSCFDELTLICTSGFELQETGSRCVKNAKYKLTGSRYSMLRVPSSLLSASQDLSRTFRARETGATSRAFFRTNKIDITWEGLVCLDAEPLGSNQIFAAFSKSRLVGNSHLY